MEIVKIFKKYQMIIIGLVLLYFINCSMEKFSKVEADEEYNKIIGQVCHSFSDKDICVKNYKKSCSDNKCRGVSNKKLCEDRCNKISL